LLLACVLVFLTMVPVAAIRLIRNRRPKGSRKPAARGARVAYWVIVGLSLLNLLVVAGLARGAMESMQNILLVPRL
jgi:hypothetical protein